MLVLASSHRRFVMWGKVNSQDKALLATNLTPWYLIIRFKKIVIKTRTILIIKSNQHHTWMEWIKINSFSLRHFHFMVLRWTRRNCNSIFMNKIKFQVIKQISIKGRHSCLKFIQKYNLIIESHKIWLNNNKFKWITLTFKTCIKICIYRKIAGTLTLKLVQPRVKTMWLESSKIIPKLIRTK